MNVDSLEPYCFPTELTVDLAKLKVSVSELLNSIGIDIGGITEECKQKFGFTVNLTHAPGVTGKDRFLANSENHTTLTLRGVSESSFTETPPELTGTYLEEVMGEIRNFHKASRGVPFVGRSQLIWVSGGNGYDFHKDYHTPHRYHIPIFTNSKCLWFFRRRGVVSSLHMPADGRVWYLDPVNIEHTVKNNGNEPRLHLLMTTA